MVTLTIKMATYTLKNSNLRLSAEDLQANFLATSRSIVGAAWVPLSPNWHIPVGLDYGKNPPPPYKMVSFAAQNEWLSDEHGWQVIRYSKKQQRSAAARRRHAATLADLDAAAV